jgi:hypothetical protein
VRLSVGAFTSVIQCSLEPHSCELMLRVNAGASGATRRQALPAPSTAAVPAHGHVALPHLKVDQRAHTLRKGSTERNGQCCEGHR